jgi:hypothetical protein
LARLLYVRVTVLGMLARLLYVSYCFWEKLARLLYAQLLYWGKSATLPYVTVTLLVSDLVASHHDLKCAFGIELYPILSSLAA